MLVHKPSWLKVRPPGGEDYATLRSLLRRLQLHTVCEEARCPNSAECWGSGTATIMIMGDVCTRGCRFCAVKSGDPHGRLDQGEPDSVASAISELGLNHVVLTSVDRDDLPDGGAKHYARTIQAIREKRPEIVVEALIPDFQGDEKALSEVVEAGPDVVGHNIETVESLTPRVRDRRSSYRQSIAILDAAKRMDHHVLTKSSIMLGLGESREEVLSAFAGLREARVDMLTVGQYLRPSEWHLPVVEYVTPEKFEEFGKEAEELGFLHVASGPLVRSSYKANEHFLSALRKKERAYDGG